MNSALYWAVCFENTNPLATHKYTVKRTVCIPMHNTRVYKQWHIQPRHRSRKDPLHVLFFSCDDFPLESLAPVTADTPLTGWNDESPLLCTCLQQKSKQSVSFRSEVWNHSFSGCQCKMVLLHHACLAASMDLLSFWLYCELSPSVSVSPSHACRGDNVLSS